jgi:hypothetical protein
MHHSLQGVKTGCEDEVFSEILSGDNWSNAISPPMTPGKFQRSDSFLWPLEIRAKCEIRANNVRSLMLLF